MKHRHNKRLGATGRYPSGKLNSSDEGELKMAVSVRDGLVHIDFGKSVQWFAMPPALAVKFAELIVHHAGKAGQVH